SNEMHGYEGQSNEPLKPDEPLLLRLQKKFTIPPKPKTILEGAKRDYMLVGGICLTVTMLSLGVWNHVKGGSAITTTRFLRARIWAQATTVALMGFYAFNYQKTLDDETRKNQKVVLN
ncbi:hypothetical protein SAMD00019534_037840, partial [Acytostelium subglobosum LB1]|uniref:hypothetical protein n=1 Tax=Acytostelium subglobosum LB1 TaxID=1410327 RepID=UPI000644B751